MLEVTTPARIPANETLLAFDFGEKRIGVALGNTLVRQAQPLKTLEVVTVAERFAAIGAVLDAWQPQRLVVGIPRSADGTAHAMTARCERFANQLHGRYGLPVERVDERYTSADAASRLRAARQGSGRRGGPTVREQVDALAAAIILQAFFDQVPDSAPPAGAGASSHQPVPDHVA